MNRRDFLKGAGIAVAASAYGSWHSAFADESLKDVLIVGAGLAGLAAGYELNKAGIAVTIFEARTRPGGRVWTCRDPFADGLYAEMGAEYVDAADEYDHKYCKEFGLKVMTARLYDAIFVRGKRFRMDPFKKNRETLPYEGAEGGILFGQEAKYLKKLIGQIKDPERLPPEILKLDNLSVAELLIQQGAPQDILTLYTYLNATEETARPDQMSALSMIRGHIRKANFTEVQDEGRIFGGNDQLTKGFAKALGGKIHYGCAVRRISQQLDSVEVAFEDAGKLDTVSASKLIIAIPFSTLREIEIKPAFSAEKMKCIQTLCYGHGMKIAMQFQKRFWDEPESLGQRIFTDTRLRRIYHMSVDQPGPRGILMSFTSADDAEQLGKLPDQERLRVAVEEVSKIWTVAPQLWEGGLSKYWNEDPWTKGSYSFTGVGQDRNYLEIAKMPEGRVHFAGEHTSPFRASMNGAIESGVRAAQEVKKNF